MGGGDGLVDAFAGGECGGGRGEEGEFGEGVDGAEAETEGVPFGLRSLLNGSGGQHHLRGGTIGKAADPLSLTAACAREVVCDLGDVGQMARNVRDR